MDSKRLLGALGREGEELGPLIAVGRNNAHGETRVKTRSVNQQSLPHLGWWMLTQRRDVSEEISKAKEMVFNESFN